MWGFPRNFLKIIATCHFRASRCDVYIETQKIKGPFAETHEQLGGYYFLEYKDLDEAIRWAAKIPTAKYGSIEVRPLWSPKSQG
jgi:hypothetical protein